MIPFFFGSLLLLAYGFGLSIASQSADHCFNRICSRENDDEAKKQVKERPTFTMEINNQTKNLLGTIKR